MEKLNSHPPGHLPTLQEQLARLRRKKERLSRQMISYSPTTPDQSRFTKLYRKLETISQQIEELTSQIPSSGPSPTTASPLHHDPQGRMPWHGKR